MEDILPPVTTAHHLINHPRIPEQDVIIAKPDSVSTHINLEQDRVAKLRAQKQGLMQDLLAGRVPVRVTGPARIKD